VNSREKHGIFTVGGESSRPSSPRDDRLDGATHDVRVGERRSCRSARNRSNRHQSAASTRDAAARRMAYRVEYLVPHLISILIAAAMAVLAHQRPSVGRGLYAALFLWAATVNVRIGLHDPASYQGFAELTLSSTYRAFITGFFARHATEILLAIAAGQAAIGVGLLLRGAIPRFAAVGAVVFMLAILPLGVGSAMPSSLIWAVGAVWLARHEWRHTLFTDVKDALRHRAAHA
jgi:hypothetical protein